MRLILKIFLSSLILLSFYVCAALPQKVKDAKDDIPVLKPHTTIIHHGHDEFCIVSEHEAKEIKLAEVRKAREEQAEIIREHARIQAKAEAARREEIYSAECAIQSAQRVQKVPIRCGERAKLAKEMPASQFINTPSLSKPIVLPATKLTHKKPIKTRQKLACAQKTVKNDGKTIVKNRVRTVRALALKPNPKKQLMLKQKNTRRILATSTTGKLKRQLIANYHATAKKSVKSRKLFAKRNTKKQNPNRKAMA